MRTEPVLPRPEVTETIGATAATYDGIQLSNNTVPSNTSPHYFPPPQTHLNGLTVVPVDATKFPQASWR